MSDSELRLSPVERGDGGQYTCHAQSRAGTVVSSAFLDVQCKCEHLTHNRVRPSTALHATAAQLTTGALRMTLLSLCNPQMPLRPGWMMSVLPV